jgi:hypothetical protein
MNTLRMTWCLALLLVSSSTWAQNRPWKVPYDFFIGQQSGFATVVVRAVDDKTNEVLAEDMLNIMVSNWRFSGLLSVAATDAASAHVMKDLTSLRVEFARASAPDAVLGTIRYSAAAYAMTLSPNAIITNNALLAQPALNISGGGVGLSALSTSSGAAISAEVTSTTSNNFVAAVEGISRSPAGAGGHFINSGGGLLIRAERVEGTTPNFSVDNDGTARTRGTAIAQYGPKGPRGDTGDKGPRGDKGELGAKGLSGAGAAFLSFGIVRIGNTCVGVCTGRAVLLASASAGSSQCTAVSEQGNVVNNMGGVCCVCGM